MARQISIPVVRQENFLTMKGRLLSYLVLFSLLCFGGSILTILNPMTCIGSESGEEPTVFSLDVRDEPLIEVFNKISKLTAYEIEVSEHWAHLSVTASIKNASIHEAFNRVLRKFNHTIVVDDLQKKVVVSIYDPGPATIQQGRIILSRQEEIDPLDVEVTPPQECGERGITQREVDEIDKSQANIDPGDLEVIPPDSPGGAGMTARELEALTRQQERNDDRTSILVPPDNVENSELPEGGKPGGN